MLRVSDIVRMREIENNLNMIEECIRYYSFDEKLSDILRVIKKFYIKNDYITTKQMNFVLSMYGQMQEEYDVKDTCNSYFYGSQKEGHNLCVKVWCKIQGLYP